MSNAEAKNKSTFSWHSHGITNVGKVRKHNEDSMLERPEVGLWVVADGMGGHAAGDVASQMIVNSLKKVHEGLSLERFIDDIEDKLIAVNKKLIDKANESSKRTTIGSTVVIMVTYDKYCVYLWAGDSRLYRTRNGELRQMTTDHSQVEQYVEQGLISREEAAVHPHGNMITRAVGATQNFFLDMDIQEIQKGDRYLLCSDGLTKHIVDFEFQEMLPNGSAEKVCKELIDLTLSRGAGDNVTAIVIDID
ncbi:MAG: protein phosphatase 2C domain-containing protein [Proteobacteria bacterium]|nr:protein phosphatase 2C domain-containing protein [Pseudomonadota bacterium]